MLRVIGFPSVLTAMPQDDPKDWFQNQSIQTKADIIQAWEKDEEAEIGDIAGRQSDEVQDLLDKILENNIEADSVGEITQRLKSDGYNEMIARNLAIAITDKRDELDSTVRFIKMNVDSADELGTISENAVKMFLGEMKADEYIDTHQNEKLLKETDDLIWNVVRSINRSRIHGLKMVKSQLVEDTVFTQQYVDELFHPVGENLEELKLQQNRRETVDIYSLSKDILSEVDEIKASIDTLHKRIRQLEEQFNKLYKAQPQNKEPTESDFYDRSETALDSRDTKRRSDDELFE